MARGPSSLTQDFPADVKTIKLAGESALVFLMPPFGGNAPTSYHS